MMPGASVAALRKHEQLYMEQQATGKKPTALVWCSSVDPAGGMERVALHIANGLAGLGWRILLAGPFSRVEFLKNAIRPEVEFLDHPAGKSPAAFLRTMRFLQRTIKERRVDIVSAHGSVFPLLPLNIPVVWTEHDLRYAGGEMLRGLRGLVWRRVRDRLRRGRWKLVTVSQYVRDETCLRLNLPGESARVVYNGLPNAAALEALPAPRLKPPYQIGFLGRLVPSKQPLDVFELSAMLNRMGVPHVWHVFGDGVLLPEMQQAAAGRQGHSVLVRGLVERPEEAFAQIDLLSFLARGEQEGLGMVLLEALAANRLVVAWDAGCIREVLAGRATLVTAPFSLERFAAAIAETLQSGRPARDRDERWGEDRMIAEYHAILSGTLGRHAQAEKDTARSHA
jgi:glycosyltransferase involved in cell wall biosynthesis